MNIPGFTGRYHLPLSKPPLSFLPFPRKKVAFKAFIPFDLSACSDPEPLYCSSFTFHFWHFALLSNRHEAEGRVFLPLPPLLILPYPSRLSYFGVNSMDMFRPSNLGEISILATSST